MEENKSINERADHILLSRVYHGKSRVARILDGVVAVLSSLVIFYILIFLLTRSNLYSVILSILLTGFVGAAIRLFDRARQRRNLARQRQTLARELCAELLCTASHEEFLRWAAPQLQKNGAVLSQDAASVTIAEQTMPAVFLRLPVDEKLQKRDLLLLPQKSGLLFVTTNCPRELAAFAKKLGFRHVIDASQTDISAFCRPSEEAVSAYILEHFSPYRKQSGTLIPQLLQPRRIRGYLLCAAFLLVSSLFSVCPVYYRISAGICILLAAAAFCLPRFSRTEQGADL